MIIPYHPWAKRFTWISVQMSHSRTVQWIIRTQLRQQYTAENINSTTASTSCFACLLKSLIAAIMLNVNSQYIVVKSHEITVFSMSLISSIVNLDYAHADVWNVQIQKLNHDDVMLMTHFIYCIKCIKSGILVNLPFSTFVNHEKFFICSILHQSGSLLSQLLGCLLCSAI